MQLFIHPSKNQIEIGSKTTFSSVLLTKWINKYEVKESDFFVVQLGQFNQTKVWTLIFLEFTVDSLAQASIRAAHVQTRGDANCATAITNAPRETGGSRHTSGSVNQTLSISWLSQQGGKAATVIKLFH